MKKKKKKKINKKKIKKKINKKNKILNHLGLLNLLLKVIDIPNVGTI